jgi:membrane protease subunit (stomatin/prohibitin family)
VLTNLMNWDKGFNSPFKSDVVFISLKEQAGLKWGTPQPVTVRDAEFGAIRLRAFGSYSFKVADLKLFLARCWAPRPRSGPTLEPQLRGAIVTAIATALGASKVPFLDLAANQQAMSDTIKAEVDKAFAGAGLPHLLCRKRQPAR